MSAPAEPVAAADEVERLRRRLERERRARVEAEAIAEGTTRDLYESIQQLETSKVDLAHATELVVLLQRAAVAANEARHLEEAAETVLSEVCTYTGWPVGHLYALDGRGGLEPTRVWHLADEAAYRTFREITERTFLAVGEGLPGRVLATARAHWVPDVTVDSNFPRAKHAVDIEVKAGFAFPVLTGTEVVGVLEFFASKPLELDASLLEVMSQIGAELGRVVERSRAQDAIRQSEEKTRQILETANDAFISIDDDGRITDWNRQAELTFGWSRDQALGQELTNTIIPPAHREAHLLGLRHYAETGQGSVLGRRLELTGCHRDGHEFPIELTPWAVRTGGKLVFNAFIHDISERKLMQEQLVHQALHDPLTGLPNRALILDRLSLALARESRSGRHTAVMFLDLDRFKAVNDSLGHEAGDRLLQSVAARLPGVLRAGDTLGRLGGDEFIVLCEDIDEDVAVIVAERILASIATPFVLPAGEAHIRTTIGVVVTTGDGRSPDELLSDADLAMYRAKERGKGTYQLFSPVLRSEVVRRLATEEALRRAIESDDLLVHYQPVADVASQRVVGVEALVRWKHEGAFIPPLEFIPLAEETGLISSLGWLVRLRSCAQLQRWDEQVPESPVYVAVNVSVRELEQPEFARGLGQMLDVFNVAPDRLLLEITESVLMRDMDLVVHRLWELRELGFRIAIDDFGTGYSSLDRLRRVPVDTLKIDKSFTDEIETTEGGTSLVGAVIAMSHSLGLTVVAEGVEEPKQLEVLTQLGCDQVQGYLLARPTTADEIPALLGTVPKIRGGWPSGGGEVGDQEAVVRAVNDALADGGAFGARARGLIAELMRLSDRSR